MKKDSSQSPQRPKVTSEEGWAGYFSHTHYFRAGVSLCGKYRPKVLAQVNPVVLAMDDHTCHRCWCLRTLESQALAREQAKREEANSAANKKG